MILIEADSGRVLHAERATQPWYPASLTKLMTSYVTLQAVKARRLTLDSLLTVSARAAAQNPSKMGFRPGTTVTVDNAIKMLMVKSANDIAVVLAEGVSGSVENFSDEMNQHAKRLGMTQSSFVNPNGLPAEEQISSARDLAILARAMIKDFPEYDFYWHIPAIKFGKRVMRNYNTLIGRYSGADGMKTGFICASGFNLVASATRGNRRLIAVVLGSPSSPVRAAKTASLLERGFSSSSTLSWLAPSLGTVESLRPIAAAPVDLRDEMCGKHRKRPAAEEADDDYPASGEDKSSTVAMMLSSLPPGQAKPSSLLGPVAAANPIVVFAGPGKKPADTQLAARGKANDRKGGKNKQTEPTLMAAPGTPQPAQQVATAPAGRTHDTFGPLTSQPGVRAAVPETAPSWMSFAPTARAATAPAPLTSMPGAANQVEVPMPRPRPSIAGRKPKQI